MRPLFAATAAAIAVALPLGAQDRPPACPHPDTATIAVPDSVGVRAPSTPAAPSPAATPASGRIAVSIFASASARSVTFAREPEIRVRLCGGLDSVRVIERRNLPTPVVAGRTYRDVYIAVEILGRIDGACLAERLGVRDSARAPAAETTRGACAAITVGGLLPGGHSPPD